MAHRTHRRPQVSVVLAVHNAADVITRCVESALSQSLRDIEVIVADLGSTDHTARLLDRIADHDFRLEVLALGELPTDAGLAAALAASQGAHAVLLRQTDWIAPSYLADALAAAAAEEAPLVIPVPGDEEAPQGSVSEVWGDETAIGRGVVRLLPTGAVDAPFGSLIARPLVEGALAPVAELRDPASWMPRLLGRAGRVAALETSAYHARPEHAPAAFDPGLFERCEREHALLLDLFASWGLDTDPACREALHRHHLTGVIRCIENACMGRGRLSSIERRQRVQDMIDACPTRDSVEALRSASSEFGLMFTPIARRSAAACYMGARIQGVVSRVLAPLSLTRSLATPY